MARRATRPTDEWLELTNVIRKAVTRRLGRHDDVEDVVQETLVRIAGARTELDPSALPGYAVITARNVVATKYRKQDRDRRHLHRLVEYRSLNTPEEVTLRREESDALAAALAKLAPADRELLVEHEVEGRSVESLAAAADTSPAAVAMRLSRARARLRLEFVLAMRGL